MLEHVLALPNPPEPGALTLVLLHGRGSNEHDLMGLRPHLPEGAIIVCPRAPFPGAPWGYGPGWAWYQFLGRGRPEPNGFSESLAQLNEFLDALPGQLPVEPGPIVLGGFSQGGTVSLAYGLGAAGPEAAEAIDAVANFSGFLAEHPEVRVTPETAAELTVFWGHGRRDPAIPFDLAEEGREALRKAGARLTERSYDLGHGISREELADLSSWLEEVKQEVGP